MKFGLRRPSFRKRFAARISVKRYVRHSLKVKVPRGWGWVTNPKRAAYNRIYNRTTVGIEDIMRGRNAKRAAARGDVLGRARSLWRWCRRSG